MEMSIEIPERVKISGNGKLSLTRIVYDDKKNSLAVDYPVQNQAGEEWLINLSSRAQKKNRA